MAHETDYAKDLTHIRTLMERSSRFISLSGLAGVFAGLFALAGAGAVYYELHYGRFTRFADFPARSQAKNDPDFVAFCFQVALMVLVAALAAAIYFTTRQARKKGQKIFDRTGIRLLINFLIPLSTGGLFCLALLYHNLPALIAPAMLTYYGLSLVHSSKYTLDDVRYLGMAEIFLGLVSSFFIGYGLVFWAIGFGVLHIIYGTAMYFKYDRTA